MAVTIGIFSRCAPELYDWLFNYLKNKDVKVLTFSISNTNKEEFRAAVSQCDFTILYHSKTRGRVNITDVNDSLYDEELRHMSAAHGRDKTFVVVDDLHDSSSETRARILENQRSIGSLARDVFLFTRADNDNEADMNDRMKPMMQSIQEALQPLTPPVSRPSSNSPEPSETGSSAKGGSHLLLYENQLVAHLWRFRDSLERF
ncbi:uncharacterized protein RCH25_037993 [Pelodytes ibericus]